MHLSSHQPYGSGQVEKSCSTPISQAVCRAQNGLNSIRRLMQIRPA